MKEKLRDGGWVYPLLGSVVVGGAAVIAGAAIHDARSGGEHEPPTQIEVVTPYPTESSLMPESTIAPDTP